MSQLNSLLESSKGSWKNLQSDAARLAGKWERTGLLEGINTETEKNNMSMILENQAKQLVVESSLSGGGTSGGTFTVGTGEQWAGVALPMVRKVFGQIAAQEFVSVQPMNLPSGLVFFLDFQYGTAKNPFSTAGGDAYGSGSMYGLTEGGSAPSEGLYGAGRFGYSINNTASVFTATVATASFAQVNFDSNFSASVADGDYKAVTVDLSNTNFDSKAVRAFEITSGSLINVNPAFTTVSGNSVTFITDGGNETNSYANTAVTFSLAPLDNERGDFEDGNTTLNGLNSTISIPEVNVKLKSESIVAKTRKLKAVWTPEFAQDLNAYQSLDAEAELTSIMSEYISLEIDLEILDMLMTSVPAGSVEYWSAENNQAINAGSTAFSSLTSGFYNTQGQWFQTLGTKVQKLSNRIHQLTLRGGANFMVCSPTVATVLESIPGYAADSSGDAAQAKYAFGVQKVGQLNGRYQVYKNPYMTENQILMGFRGTQFLETGAVFAPYIPLIMTPLVYDPDTFTPRKGLLTRYAKKMIRPEYFGKIQVSGLNTI
jgi:hypothetical protein